MPDFEVTLTHVSRDRETWTKAVKVLDVPRDQAILMGITDLFAQCEEEAKADPGSVPISAKAYECWTEARNGTAQLYEVQTALEGFGVTFGIQEISEVAPTIERNHRANRGGRPVASTAGRTPQRMDLKSMLGDQLTFLQQRQKDLAAERKALQDEYEENQASINQITQFMMLTRPPARRGRPKKQAAENGQA